MRIFWILYFIIVIMVCTLISEEPRLISEGGRKATHIYPSLIKDTLPNSMSGKVQKALSR